MNTESFLEQLQKVKSFFRLDARRKEEILSSLVKFMEASEAVRDRADNRHIMQRSDIPFSIVKPMPIVAIITVVVLLGGGTSFAAESALPGDVLYPVKVSVNEQVVAALSISSRARAEWEARLAERRLEEAAELASRSDIDAETSADLEARFAVHAERTRARILEMQLQGDARVAADIASRLETSLAAHDAILVRLREKDEDVGRIEIKVRTTLGDIHGVRSGLETSIVSEESENDEVRAEVKVAAEGKVNAATNVIASARSYLESKRNALGAEAVVKAEARLRVAEDLVMQAKAKIEVDEYGEAFNLGNQAIRVAQEARMLAEANVSFDIDVEFGGTGTLDIESETKSEGRENGSATTSIDIEVEAGSGTQGRGEVEVDIGL